MGVHGGTALFPAPSQAARAARCGCPRGRKGAPSPHTVEETLAGSVQARALPAARESILGKKEQILNHKNFTAAKS